MFIETSGPPRSKPQRGDMCTILKIVQTLVSIEHCQVCLGHTAQILFPKKV